MFDKTTENKNKIFELYSENQELVLLDKLSHEFQNFRRGFRGKLDHTYVLSPAASDMFPVTIHNGKPIMGVPDQLFEIFLDIRWYVVNILEGMNSLYLTFEIGVAPKKHPASLRVYKRKLLTEAVSRYKRMGFVRINNKGEALGFDALNYFEKPIAVKKHIDWEY
ncbi:hypothetical protein R7Q39_11130 [Vibrio sp. 947]|uniref:hypothetical protein n=1 Tax=unclassified Vibrio TaxID=2614977 RepID=UPI0029651335|nr:MULTISPECIES: hypothetical protein [unclassified Vibrio]MDW1582328.1 hypothetical protein [Vibrio sp. Vb2897]MDW1640589.1 hypothetical protein [Vibrio sp. Vb2896]MDW1925972.1 hypothetical protein [Vibrio sp. 947]